VILLPVSAVIGVIGYNLESILSDKYTPYKPSIEEQREDRQLAEATSANGNGTITVDKLEDRKFIPKTIFERNISSNVKKPPPSSLPECNTQKAV